jgi:hypothetical protein
MKSTSYPTSPGSDQTIHIVGFENAEVRSRPVFAAFAATRSAVAERHDGI